jgi:hypothetical protein
MSFPLLPTSPPLIRTTLRVDPPVSTGTFLDRVRHLDPVDDIENCTDTTLQGTTVAETVDSGRVSDSVATEVEQMALASFSFRKETDISYMTVSDSTVRERTETDDRTVSIVYHEDGYVFVSGPGGRTATEGETVAERLFDAEDVQRIDIEEGFLRWLVWQTHSDGSLESELDIDRLSVARVVGGGPPEEFQLSGNDPLGSQQPRRFLQRIRDGHRIDRLDGAFRLRGVDLSGRITTFAGISASVGGTETAAAAATESVVAVVFCLSTLGLFERWRSRPQSEREPEPAFADVVEAALAEQTDY